VTRLRLLVVLLSTLAAAALFALAVDVLAASRSLEADDVRFESASTRQDGLWEDPGVLPGSIALRVLAADDDLAYRRVASAFQLVRPSDRLFNRVGTGDTRLESLRGQVQLELTRTSQAETDERRRSRLLTFLGVLPLDRVVTDGDERAGVLRTAIGIFQTAVQSDPGNADAKLNLELLLRDALATSLPPNAPGGHPAGGPRSAPGGLGSSGGY
jgi:hypothetical protein